MARLWNMIDGEPWLDNPRLLILNSPKSERKKTMRRNTRRRRRPYRMNRRRSSARMHARSRSNFRPNPHRRRHYRRNLFVNRGKRRHYRRNPPSFAMGGDILGFPIKQVLTAGGAVIVAPYLEHEILNLLPVSFAAQTSGRWTAKVGAAVGVGYLAKMALGNEASRLAYIVLGANLVADAVAEFMPTLIPGAVPAPLSFYPRGMGFYANALGAAGDRSSRMALPVYAGITGTAGRAMTAAQDPFTPVF